MKVERTEVVERYVCDCCGKEIEDGGSYAYLTMHGPVSWISEGIGVAFERNSKGDYCRDCCMKLVSAVSEKIDLPERYQRVSAEEQIAKEVEMIMGWDSDADD